MSTELKTAKIELIEKFSCNDKEEYTPVRDSISKIVFV